MMIIASRKPVRGDFYAHILDSNIFISLKFDTDGNIWANFLIGTLAIAVHWKMNAIAPYGFIVEECSRGVNIQRYITVAH